MAHTWWYFIRILEPGRLIVRGTGVDETPRVDIYVGDDLTTLEFVATGSPGSEIVGTETLFFQQADIAVTPGVYYIRLMTDEVTQATMSHDFIAVGQILRKAKGFWDVGFQAYTTITGAGCEVEVQARPGTMTVNPVVQFPGRTANVLVRAYPGSLTFSSPFVILPGSHASVTVVARPGALVTGAQYKPGTFWWPTELVGLSGVFAISMDANVLDPGEPQEIVNVGEDIGSSGEVPPGSHVWWLHSRPDVSGTLNFDALRADPAMHLSTEVYRLESDGTYVPVMRLPEEETADIPGNVHRPSRVLAGRDYYIRLVAPAYLDGYSSLAVAISYQMVVSQSSMTILTDASTFATAPAAFHATVLGAGPSEDVELTWSPPFSVWQSAAIPRPINLSTVTTDFTGNVGPFTVTVPATVQGTHTVTVTGLNSGKVATFALTFLLNPDGTSSGPIGGSAGEFGDFAYLHSGPADTVFTPEGPPTHTHPPAENQVGRWQLNDPTSGGLGEFVFPINPSQMSSPYAARVYTVEHTTSLNGQAILWENGLTGHSWTFEGYLETKAFHDKLVAFHALRRRFWLTDHRGRIWMVTFTDLDLTPLKPRRNVDKPWCHTYRLTCLAFGEAD